MNKRAFTLIELMVSIALTVIVVLFLYKALATQEISNKVLAKNAASLHQTDQIFDLLYKDFLESNETKIATTFNKDYNILYLSTKNSLHDIPFAHVVYYVNVKDKTLVRLESAHPMKLPVDLEKIKYIFADTLIDKVTKFRVFQSQQESSQKRRELLPGEAPPKSRLTNIPSKYLLFFENGRKSTVFEVGKID